MNYHTKTTPELLKMMADVEQAPANRKPPGGLYLYTPAARKKLDAIALAITANAAEARRLAGDPVRADGYSGRQSNRR